MPVQSFVRPLSSKNTLEPTGSTTDEEGSTSPRSVVTATSTPKPSMLGKIGGAVTGSVKAVGDATVSVASGAVDMTTSAAGAVDSGASSVGTTVTESVQGGAEATESDVGDGPSTIGGAVAESIKAAASLAVDATTSAAGAVGNGASPIGGAVTGTVKAVGDATASVASGAIEMTKATPCDVDAEPANVGVDAYARLNVKVIAASGLRAGDSNLTGKNSSDPYCVVTLMSDNVSRRTKVVERTLDPVWNHDCTTMVVDTPCQQMKVEVFDHDMTSDDLLGTAMVDLTHLVSGGSSAGWVPIMHEGAPSGAVHLDLQINFTFASELIAYVQNAIEPSPVTTEKFDINKVYGPIMFMADILWFGLLQPFLMDQVLPILFWENWTRSLLVLIGWLFASYFVGYWMAFAFFGLAACMLRNKLSTNASNKATTSSKSGQVVPEDAEGDAKDASDDKPKEQSFGTVVTTSARLSPGWVKEMAAGFQPLLRTLADAVGMARDIVLWRSPSSKYAFLGMIAVGIVLWIVPFWLLVAAAGTGLLLANCPVKGISVGLGKVVARPKPTGDLGLLASVEEQHMSQDYKKIVLKQK